MKKVLIISYFFSPCNLTASQRVHGWAKHLHKFGFYPIIITRNWDNPIKTTEDILKKSGDKITIEKTDNYEVHYLPYSPSIRDKIYTKLSYTPFQKLSKIFTLASMVLENFTTRFIPHRNLYSYSKDLLKQSPGIKQIVISGNPFDQFQFGYRLKKRYNIDWIADYRDDWNTSELLELKGRLPKWLIRLQEKSEKKWVGTASHITSVSPHYVNKISNFVNVPGSVILNGFDKEKIDNQTETDSEVFRITYNGNLYDSQPIEIFLNAIEDILENKANEIPIQICFPGLAFLKEQEQRVLKLSNKFKNLVKITNRIPKNEVLELQMKSDLLLMVGHQKIKGVTSSKLFEYIGLKKEILVCPGDNDIVDQIIKESKSGHICNNVVDAKQQILKLIQNKVSGKLEKETNNDSRMKFSREEQTKNLANLLKK